MEMLPASRDAATHPAVHRIAPTTKSSQAPNVSGAEAGSPCPVHLLGVLSQQAREAGVIRSHFPQSRDQGLLSCVITVCSSA